MGKSFATLIIRILLLWCWCGLGYAQGPATSSAEEPDADVQTDIQGVESELEKNYPVQSAPQVSDAIVTTNEKTAEKKPPAVVNYKELNRKKKSAETIVLQKMSMPKTSRFQLFAGLTLIANDQYYKNMGAQFRSSYHFNETWGVEATAMLLAQTKTSELKDLESKQGVSVDQLVSPKNYFGLDAYYSSIYGKAALYDRKIIPFEIYQTLGLGQMQTVSSKSSTALHLGVGQIFSRTKSDGFRWDLSVFFYNAEDINGNKQLNNNLAVTLGWGLLVPEIPKP